MAFSFNTNWGALEAYSSLEKTNAAGLKASLRLATRKKINTVSDDVSGFNVGKSLESKVVLMKSAQDNISAAKNLLGTAESALILVKDKITQIRQYIADSSDPTKDRTALAENIKSLGIELKNIFENTKFNETQLLIGKVAGSSGGTSLASLSESFTLRTGADVTDRITLDFATGLASANSGGSTYMSMGGGASKVVVDAIVSFMFYEQPVSTNWGVAIASLAHGGANSVISKFEKAVDVALGKIGNFVQRLEVKEEYLTSAITNASATVARLFDANMALEQLNATKAQIGGQIATTQLSQLNMKPQGIMSLFQ